MSIFCIFVGNANGHDFVCFSWENWWAEFNKTLLKAG